MKRKDAKTPRRKSFFRAKRSILTSLRASASLRLCVFIFLCAAFVSAQEKDWPDEIRGYKVHQAKVTVASRAEKSAGKDASETIVSVGEPVLIDTSLAGLIFELGAELDGVGHSGTVDFLSFRDFRVNGLSVEIEEYRESFSFKKNEPVALPKPVRLFLASDQALKGALGELRSSREEWTVTGTVFVFGKFKKLGFDFKRVVPVAVNVRIVNPLKTENSLPDIIPSF